MINRQIAKYIIVNLDKYPVLSLTGPRQSGKSTLLINLLKQYEYVTLEDLDIRKFAIDDPRGFLERYNDKVIIDEAQYAPDLFSYIQTATDFSDKTGQYVLSGSQNFLLIKNIKQSLAGRVSIHKLLPFSYQELSDGGIETQTPEFILKGGYPRIYDKDIPPGEFYENYIQTYVDRDVEELLSVREIVSFNKFLRLCATRIGQIMDITSLANDCGIARQTAKSWLSILESSYIAFELPPYSVNIGKRLIKSPKLYFYDVGLACYLLGIRSEKSLRSHKMYGALFENLVVGEIIKKYYNQKITPDLYFLRDSNGSEIDIIDNTSSDLAIVEIKSSKTAKSDYATNLYEIADLLKVSLERCGVIYDGQNMTISGVEYKNWREI